MSGTSPAAMFVLKTVLGPVNVGSDALFVMH